jgi:hypothetical protein
MKSVRVAAVQVADLDLDTLPARKRLFDPTGHYNRSDAFCLAEGDVGRVALCLWRSHVLDLGIQGRHAVLVPGRLGNRARVDILAPCRNLPAST